MIIHTKTGDRTLPANAHAEIIIPLSPDLLDEDPELTLSEIPATVEIVTRLTPQ